ncbi:4-aminobutyrate--2-oxoglutarate transaminase [Haloplanus salinarum]
MSNAHVESQYDDYVMPIWKSLNVPVKRSDGCTLVDFDGTEYLDVFSGISVTNVGHGNDAVVETASEQLEELIHSCSYVHPNEPMGKLAETIAEISPGNLQKTFFCNSGTEAVEGAIKLARKHTGSKEVIGLEMGFHGRTLGSLALTGNKSYKNGMAPTINDVAHTPPPYAYRCSQCDGGPCDTTCADQLDHIIGTHTSGDLAAVVVEPVMGEAGIIVPPEGWLDKVQQITHDHDALLIVDEVQTGYGRTGHMFASEHYDLQPDILTQAKGIANGLPLGAFTAPEAIANSFESGDHLSTFGGNPVACAAALATIDELSDDRLRAVRDHGEWLRSRLGDLETVFDCVGQARGLGLMWGLELVDPDGTGPVSDAPAPDPKLAREVGTHLREAEQLVIGVGGYYKNVLRFQPPLTITRDQLDDAVSAVRRTLETLAD